MYGIGRRIHRASTECIPRLTRFILHPPYSVSDACHFLYHNPGKVCFEVEVEFGDGKVYNLSAEFLRVYSPAVDSKIRSIAGEKVISGRRHVGIMSAEPIGNYGVRILFNDLHKTGIYTWDYCYHLGSNKFTLMRNYVTTLKKHGLTRDPPPRRK